MVAEGALCGDGVSLGSVPPIFGPSAGADPCTHPKNLSPHCPAPHLGGLVPTACSHSSIGPVGKTSMGIGANLRGQCGETLGRGHRRGQTWKWGN